MHPQLATNEMDRSIVGSLAARGGFRNEQNVVVKFNNWQNDAIVQHWLNLMGINLEEILYVRAVQVPLKITLANFEEARSYSEDLAIINTFKKADILVSIKMQDNVIKKETLSLKKANVKANYNQIDKRSVDSYQAMWGFDDEIAFWLKLFSGQIVPENFLHYTVDLASLRNNRRIFMDEMPLEVQTKILTFFETHRRKIVEDVFKGRHDLSAKWILVTKVENENTTWDLKNINTVLDYFGCHGEVTKTPKRSISIGEVTLQRKGGTPDPTKLQFKFNPCTLFDIQ